MSDQESKIHWWDRVLEKTLLPLLPPIIRPNHITVLRLLLIPIVILLLWFNQLVWGTMLFFIAAFTDALDGAMARTRKQITDWGRLFDPLADKLLICSTVFVLIIKYVDFYAAWIIISLEVFIVAGAIYEKSKGTQVPRSNIWGKVKMLLQVAGVMILLLSIIFDLQSFFSLSLGLLYLAVGFGVMSLFTYGI